MSQTKYQTLNSQKSLATKKGPIIRQAEALDENRIVLYKKGKQLGQGYYIVEISSNNTHLFIAAYDVESPESLLIELPERRAQDILNEFQNDYESMASSLQVMNKRLVLLNPVSILFILIFDRNSSTKKELRLPPKAADRSRWRKYNRRKTWRKFHMMKAHPPRAITKRCLCSQRKYNNRRKIEENKLENKILTICKNYSN